MRQVSLTLLSVLATGAFSLAGAQEQVRGETDLGPVTRISADEVPAAPDAVPDWYQRFSSDDLDQAYPIWVGNQPNDVQLELTSNRRWNLQLGLSSRNGEGGLHREEMWAGATYNITSRLSIGGSVGIESENFTIDGDRVDQQFEPGIRLQSAFKF